MWIFSFIFLLLQLNVLFSVAEFVDEQPFHLGAVTMFWAGMSMQQSDRQHVAVIEI